MLPQAAEEIASMAAIEPSSTFTLQNVGPIRHQDLEMRRGLIKIKTKPLFLTGSPSRTRTYNLVVNSHPLCRLSYRGAFDFLSYEFTLYLPQPVP